MLDQSLGVQQGVQLASVDLALLLFLQRPLCSDLQ